MDITIQQLEQISIEKGLPVWAVLDEIIELEIINQKSKP